MTFFWPYVIIMFGFKYYKNPQIVIMFIFLALLLAAWVDVYFFALINGLNYIYQIVTGQLMGFFFLIGALTFDNELHKYTLQTGFSIRSSRAKKFYLFFFLITIEVVIICYYFTA